MKGNRDFNKFGEHSHQRVIKIFEQDKAFQTEYKDYFSKNPNTLRIRFKQIEAGAWGVREEDDGSYIDFNNNTPATEKQLAYVRSLGGEPNKDWTKREASREIERLKNLPKTEDETGGEE